MARNNELNIGHILTFVALIGSVVLWGFEIERRITRNDNQINSLRDIIDLERQDYHRSMTDLKQDIEQIEDRMAMKMQSRK